MTHHLTRTVQRRLHELLIDEAHQPQVQRALPATRVVQAGAADRQQFALSNHWQRMFASNQFAPPGHAHRPEAFAKKSRSMINWPILACSLETSAALTVGSSAEPFGEKLFP